MFYVHALIYKWAQTNNDNVLLLLSCQDQAAPEAVRGTGESGGLSHWQGTGLLQTWRLVHVSPSH